MITAIYVLMLIVCLILTLFSGLLAVWMIVAIRQENKIRYPKTKDNWRWP